MDDMDSFLKIILTVCAVLALPLGSLIGYIILTKEWFANKLRPVRDSDYYVFLKSTNDTLGKDISAKKDKRYTIKSKLVDTDDSYKLGKTANIFWIGVNFNKKQIDEYPLYELLESIASELTKDRKNIFPALLFIPNRFPMDNEKKEEYIKKLYNYVFKNTGIIYDQQNVNKIAYFLSNFDVIEKQNLIENERQIDENYFGTRKGKVVPCIEMDLLERNLILFTHEKDPKFAIMRTFERNIKSVFNTLFNLLKETFKLEGDDQCRCSLFYFSDIYHRLVPFCTYGQGRCKFHDAQSLTDRTFYPPDYFHVGESYCKENVMAVYVPSENQTEYITAWKESFNEPKYTCNESAAFSIIKNQSRRSHFHSGIPLSLADNNHRFVLCFDIEILELNNKDEQLEEFKRIIDKWRKNKAKDFIENYIDVFGTYPKRCEDSISS